MREVLFRGKRTDNGTWTCGYLFCIRERAYLCWGATNNVPNMKEVLPETVCQFTGLYDKNGRKIFEGDIVERGGRIWRVEYGDNYGKFMMTTYTEKGVSWDRDFDTIPPDWCEVIGNIYDNPELLKGGNENG